MMTRILIADDCPEICQIMQAILDSSGYLVTIAQDGIDAWEAFSRDRPSMVVLDIEMPGLNGCEICRMIKSRPDTWDIPVLLVSGCGRTADLARSAGADGFLDKPFHLADLLGQVNSLLRSMPQRAAAAAI
jgi:two-component system response regulator MprA